MWGAALWRGAAERRAWVATGRPVDATGRRDGEASLRFATPWWTEVPAAPPGWRPILLVPLLPQLGRPRPPIAGRRAWSSARQMPSARAGVVRSSRRRTSPARRCDRPGPPALLLAQPGRATAR